LELYREMIQPFNGILPGDLTLIPLPKLSVCTTSFAAYKAIMCKIYKVQKMEQRLALHWDDIWTLKCEALAAHVKKREPKVKKTMYQEKVDGTFAPYMIVEKYSDIEEELWVLSKHESNNRSINTGLKNQYIALHLTQSILRCESVYKVELSDFCGVYVPMKESNIHPMYVMVSQIAEGKTNHGRLLYGWAT
jgi:hypothetical protein